MSKSLNINDAKFEPTGKTGSLEFPVHFAYPARRRWKTGRGVLRIYFDKMRKIDLGEDRYEVEFSIKFRTDWWIKRRLPKLFFTVLEDIPRIPEKIEKTLGNIHPLDPPFIWLCRKAEFSQGTRLIAIVETHKKPFPFEPLKLKPL